MDGPCKQMLVGGSKCYFSSRESRAVREPARPGPWLAMVKEENGNRTIFGGGRGFVEISIMVGRESVLWPERAR